MKEENEFDIKKEIFSWIKVIVCALVLAYVINNFLIINANVPSGSMENTIMTKDRMIGNRLAYVFDDVERYDVIIFKYPDNETETYVKRVIGLPGETVIISDGHVFVEGVGQLDDSYIKEEMKEEEYMEFTVPDGCYFVMGDNRNDSWDSRYWINTYVKKDEILGKAVFVYWPFKDASLIK
ncbi:MAG: signal peptidase I [Eubacterium sp.]